MVLLPSDPLDYWTSNRDKYSKILKRHWSELVCEIKIQEKEELYINLHYNRTVKDENQVLFTKNTSKKEIHSS